MTQSKPMGRPPILSLLIQALVVQDYQSTSKPSMADLAKKYNVTKDVVFRIIKKAGTK